jgi:hypothetical protein
LVLVVSWVLQQQRCHERLPAFSVLADWYGVLKGCMHLVWCESLSFNLFQHEVFRHFEQSLGHGTFLGMGGWQE